VAHFTTAEIPNLFPSAIDFSKIEFLLRIIFATFGLFQALELKQKPCPRIITMKKLDQKGIHYFPASVMSTQTAKVGGADSISNISFTSYG
jgi:hypothetical protein